MKCDQCDKDATVHLTEMGGGKKVERHFCEPCAEHEKTVAMVPNDGTKAVLTYQSVPAEMVTVARYALPIQAKSDSALLTDFGICAFVRCPEFNPAHTLIGMQCQGYTDDFELQVPKKDADRAREILRASIEDVEPVEEPADAPPILNGGGRPVTVVAAAGFESVREMRDAMTLLAAEGIHYYSPTLARRGDRPPGHGKRFIIRVREEDVEHAQACLAQAEADAADDREPRCPICKSRQIVRLSVFWPSFLAFFGLGTWPQRLNECVMCHHRAPAVDFEPR